VGYGISAPCKLGLAIGAGALGAVAALVVVDRAGKGLRTGPRDAMISFTSSPAALTTAFGVHRALDTAGAMLGR
jgi:gas vesicle protein